MHLENKTSYAMSWIFSLQLTFLPGIGFAHTGRYKPKTKRVCTLFYLFYFILQNSPYIRITITQQNLHTLNKCHTHNGWNDHTEMKSPITGFQYKT